MSEDSSERPAFNSVDAYYSIARALQVRKEYRRALHYLGLALKQDDKHIPSYLLRSVCHMYLCETDEALSDVQTVLQYERKNPHALLLLGEIYYLRGDFESALQTFHQGRNLRPTIEEFLVGVHKCEAAIQNTCDDCTIQLGPDLDLTDFYTRAFPPKRVSRPSKFTLSRGTKSDVLEESPVWPKERSNQMQRKLMKQNFSEFNYLEKIFNVENERIRNFEKGNAEYYPNLNDVIDRSKENRNAAVKCGFYLDKHANLFHQLDPGFRHTNSDL